MSYPLISAKYLLMPGPSSSGLIKGAAAEEELDELVPGYSASGQDVWLHPSVASGRGAGLILSAVGARCGKVFLATAPQWGTVANTVAWKIAPHWDPEFTHYLFNREDFWIKGGTAQPYVQVPVSLAQKVPKFPLQDQIVLRNYLNLETAQIDGLIAKQKQLIETLEERRKTVITRAVTLGVRKEVTLIPTTKATLECIPDNWKLSKLRSLAIVISKGTTPSTIGAEYQDSGVRFLRGEDLVGGDVVSNTPLFISQETDEMLSRSRLQAGDILFVIAGTLGKIGVVQPEILPANTNQAIAFIRLKDPDLVRFVSYWLQSRNVEELTSLMAVTAAQPNLSMQNLGNFPVPLPPQEEIVEILRYLDESLAKTDSLVTHARKMIDVLKERRQALINAAVTGKIDVRGN